MCTSPPQMQTLKHICDGLTMLPGFVMSMRFHHIPLFTRMAYGIFSLISMTHHLLPLKHVTFKYDVLAQQATALITIMSSLPTFTPSKTVMSQYDTLDRLFQAAYIMLVMYYTCAFYQQENKHIIANFTGSCIAVTVLPYLLSHQNHMILMTWSLLICTYLLAKKYPYFCAVYHLAGHLAVAQVWAIF